ncbi:MAG TPA: hypothetical protein VFF06_21790, partial [Polyangia bacterium]|nr:hypothetical protein [Polyangia bacterium]
NHCGSCSACGAGNNACCSGTCTNTNTDSNNCGACGAAPCGAGNFCSAGKCCPTGTVNCGGVCVNEQTDINHCGSCSACGAGNNQCCSGGCSNSNTDNAHCGNCGTSCGAGNFCSAGKCCATGQTNCGGTCVNEQTDVNHCGSCSACGAGNNACCSGACTNTNTDNNNCGGCNMGCAAGTTCKSGICCTAAQTNCGGVCVNLQTDPNHCGACSGATAVCSTYGVCSDGVCLYAPSGVQASVPVASLTGWSQCYLDTYNTIMSTNTVLAACTKARLMLACRPTGNATLQTLAWADRASITTDTGQGAADLTTTTANNVQWYFDPAWSWGYLPVGDTFNHFTCDTTVGTDPTLRLCWETSGVGGGYRCGSNRALNNLNTFERIVYQAD